MIGYVRLDHIQICIPVGKEDLARVFYTDTMGLKEIPKPVSLLKNGGLWFQMANIQLHIGTEIEINNSKRHPAFEVADLKEARAHLEGKGVKVKEEIEIPGQERFSFLDPFNNRIELLQKVNPTAH
jgi:catechol 2,3-dioxygenase-like lactoylglutathione lyase family enzyme